MMFWMRKAHVELEGATPDSGGPAIGSIGSIGIEDGIVRRETFATLMDIDVAYVETRRQCEALLEHARDEAATILVEAQMQADELIAGAEQRYTSAFSQGQEEGLRQAVADWHARSAQHFLDQKAVLIKTRERFAQLVATALERIAGSIDRGAVFVQAAREMDRLIDAGSPLTVRVHPDDLAAAREAFDRCAQRWLELGRPVTLTVLAERQLSPGACVCESDLGMIDAGLDTQLTGMRTALDDLLRNMPIEWAPVTDEA
jgi:type III secretion protein L